MIVCANVERELELFRIVPEHALVMIKRSTVFLAPSALFISNTAFFVRVLIATRLGLDWMNQQLGELVLDLLEIVITVIESHLNWAVVVLAFGIILAVRAIAPDAGLVGVALVLLFVSIAFLMVGYVLQLVQGGTDVRFLGEDSSHKNGYVLH